MTGAEAKVAYDRINYGGGIALKIWPYFALRIATQEKKFEFRKDDRDFKIGSKVHLFIFDGDAQRFTGEQTIVVIRYLLRGPAFGLPEGYVIFNW